MCETCFVTKYYFELSVNSNCRTIAFCNSSLDNQLTFAICLHNNLILEGVFLLLKKLTFWQHFNDISWAYLTRQFFVLKTNYINNITLALHVKQFCSFSILISIHSPKLEESKDNQLTDKTKNSNHKRAD